MTPKVVDLSGLCPSRPVHRRRFFCASDAACSESCCQSFPSGEEADGGGVRLDTARLRMSPWCTNFPPLISFRSLRRIFHPTTPRRGGFGAGSKSLVMSSKTGDLLLELEAENASVRDKWVSQHTWISVLLLSLAS